MKLNNKVTLLNILSSLIMQIVSIISALIIPRLILETFGSNINGLVASITQFLNYIALIEGGITGVISANLYKPLVDEDTEKLNSILATTRNFYQKIGIIFIGYSVVIGLVYPLIVDTSFEYWYIFVLTLVLSIGLMLQYMFSLTYTTLLNAAKKVYFVSIISSILIVANIFLTLIVVKIYPDIIILKFANAILFALSPLIYSIYIRKHFNINWKAPKNNSLIEQRWNGFAINLAFFIHTSTDITLLTLLSDLKTVSVYSIYYLIVSKISVVIHSIVSGVEPTIGQAYALNNENELNKKMDLYEFIILFTVGFLFLMIGLLITPFVMIYTKGITDANYYQPLFAIVLVLAEVIYLLRYPHVSLAYTANKFKEIAAPAYIEAIINIAVSVLLIKRIGLLGIAIGTLIGMIYRGMFHVYFTSKLIPSRPQSIFYKKILILLIPSFISILICTMLFPISNYSILSWIIHALIYALICGVLLIVTALLFFKKEVQYIKIYLKR